MPLLPCGGGLYLFSTYSRYKSSPIVVHRKIIKKKKFEPKKGYSPLLYTLSKLQLLLNSPTVRFWWHTKKKTHVPDRFVDFATIFAVVLFHRGPKGLGTLFRHNLKSLTIRAFSEMYTADQREETPRHLLISLQRWPWPGFHKCRLASLLSPACGRRRVCVTNPTHRGWHNSLLVGVCRAVKDFSSLETPWVIRA